MTRDYEALMRLIQARRSIRKFQERAVEQAVLNQVLEAARWAPSNHNRQPWRFLVLNNPKHIAAIAAAVGEALDSKLATLPAPAQPFLQDLRHHATLFAGAPTVVVVCHKKPILLATDLLSDIPNPFLVSGEPISAAMAVQNMLLAAHAADLGSCVLTAPLMAPNAVQQKVRIPAGHDLTCLVALGYPAETPPPPRRKNLELITEYILDNT